MAYQPTSLYRLLTDINQDLFLPHIQRPFVWDEDQIRRLFDSLMRNFPIQTFLFWRTKDAIKVRKFMTSLDWWAELHKYYDDSKSARGIEKRFVLDGQQRLQALYALFKGTLILDDDEPGQEAYIDITGGQRPSGTDLSYELTFSSEPLPLPSYRLRDLTERHDQTSSEEIADKLNDELDHLLDESGDERKARHRRIRLNLGQLTSLLREENYFWVEELDGVAKDYPYKKILNIFVRVNSGGTKLEAADLLFATMKEGWADVEQNVEEMVGVLLPSKTGHAT